MPRTRSCSMALVAAVAALLLSACASGPDEAAPVRGPDATLWQPMLLPGKSPTAYRWTEKDGRPAIRARAERSASMWRRTVDVPADRLGDVSFSWWVPALLSQASVAEVDREDAAARVVFAFDGDHARLPARTRAMFELAHALTGERPPYATLMYVFDAHAAPGTVVVNPRTDRIRKIVLDQAPEHLGRWRDHRRDLAADYRRAFGEAPGRLVAVGVMTDGDNTASRVEAWYGPIRLHDPS